MMVLTTLASAAAMLAPVQEETAARHQQAAGDSPLARLREAEARREQVREERRKARITARVLAWNRLARCVRCGKPLGRPGQSPAVRTPSGLAHQDCVGKGN